MSDNITERVEALLEKPRSEDHTKLMSLVILEFFNRHGLNVDQRGVVDSASGEVLFKHQLSAELVRWGFVEVERRLGVQVSHE